MVLLYAGNLVFVLWVAFGRMDSCVCDVMLSADYLVDVHDGTLLVYGALPMALNPSEVRNRCHMAPDDYCNKMTESFMLFCILYTISNFDLRPQ
jgi:hypothetical protein